MSDTKSSNTGLVEPVVIWFIPSLVSMLLRAETDKGSPLTEEEVYSIRDKSSAVMIPVFQIPTLKEKRGYRDIDADHTWAEWQRVRVNFEKKRRS